MILQTDIFSLLTRQNIIATNAGKTAVPVKVRTSAQHAWEVSTLIQSAEFVRNVLKIVRPASTIPSARNAPRTSISTTIKASALSATFTGMEQMARVIIYIF